MTSKEKAVDRRLRLKYGISLEDYNKTLASQKGKCKICGKPPKEGGRSLHVDHDHILPKTKIEIHIAVSDSANYTYIGKAQLVHKGFFVGGDTKKDIRHRLKQILLRKSVRGLLCWKCNTGLKKWNDNPDLMEAAAKYIRSYKEKLKGSNE